MAHQALQHLQRNTVVQHMHGIGMPESMWRHRYRECHAVGRSGFNRFIQLGPDGPVGNFPDTCLLHSAGTFIAALERDFQRGHHHLQLADVLFI